MSNPSTKAKELVEAFESATYRWGHVNDMRTTAAKNMAAARAKLLDYITFLETDIQRYEDAANFEYPSGNWAMTIDRGLAPDLVAAWNAVAEENQQLRTTDVDLALRIARAQ